ncbi:hypothetical protein Tco_0349779 [Tanacetum coccineum]
MLNSDSIPSDDSLGSDPEVSFPFGTRKKIFDPGIFFEVQSKRFLSRDTFSISFIRDPLSSVFDTLLLFSSENEEKVFNPSNGYSLKDKNQAKRTKLSMGMEKRGKVKVKEVNKARDSVILDYEDSTVTYTDVSPVMPEDPYAYVVVAFQAPPSPDYV